MNILEYQTRQWSVTCPKCNAPVSAPCADWRTYDRTLYGCRTHRERQKALRQRGVKECLQ